MKSSLDVGAQSAVADLRIPASAIRWNFRGGKDERIYLGGGGSTLGVFYAPTTTWRCEARPIFMELS